VFEKQEAAKGFPPDVGPCFFRLLMYFCTCCGVMQPKGFGLLAPQSLPTS